MLSPKQILLKRSMDIIAASIGFIVFGWVILLLWFVLTILYRENGVFIQERIGKDGIPFNIIKLKTMVSSISAEQTSGITLQDDIRISKFGRLLRNFKLDELPQIWNVLKGDMSIVGPRPDLPGYADILTGEARQILILRPGITGPASLYFRNEEYLLATSDSPLEHNDRVLWPEKVRINMAYLRNYSLWLDIQFMVYTVLPFLRVNYMKLLNYEPLVSLKNGVKR